MLLNSAFVIGIGVLMFPILRAHNKAIAAGYLGTRIFEGVVLAIGVVSLIVLTGSAAIHANSVFYSVAEAGLGIGSLFFCALLFRTGLVPRFLAVWGFIGYACFAGGNLLELFGVAGAGLVGTIPGGLFELTFGIWLIAKGFSSAPAPEPSGAAVPVAGELTDEPAHPSEKQRSTEISSKRSSHVTAENCGRSRNPVLRPDGHVHARCLVHPGVREW